MKLTVLVENTSCSAAEAAHGLSLLIETADHRILFDAGPDGELLFRNAAVLGIDLGTVDFAFLSHGHFDHAGGLADFLGYNSRAKLYLQHRALAPHFAEEADGLRYIGVAPELSDLFAARIIMTDDIFSITPHITSFAEVQSADYLSESCRSLLEPDGEGGYAPDAFYHEQNLLIQENGKLILIAGCAHRGIINILRSAKMIAGRVPDAVYAGFHLTNPGKGIDEPEDFVRSVGEELKKWPCRFYTGHCTGKGPYGILKEILGERLFYLGGGMTFEE